MKLRLKILLVIMVAVAALVLAATAFATTTVYTTTLKVQEWDTYFTTNIIADVNVDLSLNQIKNGAVVDLLVKHCPTTANNCFFDADVIKETQIVAPDLSTNIIIPNGSPGLWLVQVGSPKSHSTSGSIATLSIN